MQVATKPLPSGLKPAAGQYVLLLIPGYWGRGTTMASAKSALIANGGRIDNRTVWRVYSVDPSTTVDEMGTIMRTTGTPAPVLLAES